MKRKSVLVAVMLAFLFGPIGLFYLSAAQAVIGVLAWLVVVPGVLMANPEGVGTVAMACWLICIAVAWSMARERNKEIDRAKAADERKHQEVLAALERAGQR